MLSLAGIITPVVATAANGFPLEVETDERRTKFVFLDTGLLLSVLRLDGNVSQELIKLIMTGTSQDLVNKGGITEMMAGLELMRYQPPYSEPVCIIGRRQVKALPKLTTSPFRICTFSLSR